MPAHRGAREVYVGVRDGTDGRLAGCVKIGVSADAPKRLRGQQLEQRFIFTFNNWEATCLAESALHYGCRQWLVFREREWFHDEPELWGLLESVSTAYQRTRNLRYPNATFLDRLPEIVAGTDGIGRGALGDLEALPTFRVAA